MRLPCPHCGSTLLGVGYGQAKTPSKFGKEYCNVKCRRCFATGPWGANEDEAWRLWNAREIYDRRKMDGHLKLCRKNLKSNRVACCATCPFEDLIVSHDVRMAGLFDAKRRGRHA
jgi:hypothetical protein